jgi:hypothetical protein
VLSGQTVPPLDNRWSATSSCLISCNHASPLGTKPSGRGAWRGYKAWARRASLSTAAESRSIWLDVMQFATPGAALSAPSGSGVLAARQWCRAVTWPERTIRSVSVNNADSLRPVSSARREVAPLVRPWAAHRAAPAFSAARGRSTSLRGKSNVGIAIGQSKPPGTGAFTHKSRLFGNRWLPQTSCALCRMFRRSSAAVATSRGGHHQPRLGQADLRPRLGQEQPE